MVHKMELMDIIIHTFRNDDHFNKLLHKGFKNIMHLYLHKYFQLYLNFEQVLNQII